MPKWMGKVHGGKYHGRGSAPGQSGDNFFHRHCPASIVIVSITGTPGTGKSSVGGTLASRGHQIIELGDFVKEHGLYDSYDAARGSYNVDPEVLDAALRGHLPEGIVFLIGHLAHLVTCDLIVVLRCRPSVLAKRLESRGWSAAKVRENAGAEALDVILVESVETSAAVAEIDTTAIPLEEVADAVEQVLAGEKEKYAVGNVDWSAEVLEWF